MSMSQPTTSGKQEPELERFMVAAAQKGYHDHTGRKLSESEAVAILAAVTQCMSDYAKATGRNYVA